MMELPPRRKVKREIARILSFKTLQRVARYLAKFYLRTPPHTLWSDLASIGKVKVADGHCALSRRVAVFVIFPKAGILDSHIVALESILEDGFVPLVVSNCRLTSEQRGRLAPLCSHVIERPNIGYDFGAYRQAMLFLSDKFASIDRLALLNDSAWFLVGPGDSFLKTASGRQESFVGALGHPLALRDEGTSLSRPEQRQILDWQDRAIEKGILRRPIIADSLHSKRNFPEVLANFHYSSFALAIGSDVIRQRGFDRFWREIELSDNHERTILFGELALSRWIVERGFSHAPVFDGERFALSILNAADRELEKLLRSAIFHHDHLVGHGADERQLAKLRATLREGDQPDLSTWREAAVDLLMICLTLNIAYVHPSLLLSTRGFSFLKKKPFVEGWQSLDLAIGEISRHDGKVGKGVLPSETLRRECAMIREARQAGPGGLPVTAVPELSLAIDRRQSRLPPCIGVRSRENASSPAAGDPAA